MNQKSARRPFFYYLPLVFFLFIALAGAQSGTKYFFEQGNKAYRANQYEKALEWYRKIVAGGYESASLYYNMGNSYYRLNRIGEAILFYQKALKLNPKDKEIRGNLELARLKTIDRIELPPEFFLFKWWKNLRNYYTLSQWTRVTVTLYLITLTFAILMVLFKGRRIFFRLRFPMLLAGVLTLFSGYFLLSNIRQSKFEKEGIVLAPSVTITNAPEDGSSAAFVLHEGIKVRLTEDRGDWVQILLPDGKSGWMRKSDLGII